MGGVVNEETGSETKPSWALQKKLKIALLIAFLVIGGTWVWFQMTYPYGVSHCCSKAIALALRQYAEEHQGSFPNGKSSPEASLSLLYTNYEPSLYTLRGKNIPLKLAQAAWDEDLELGPQSCGWHYVEGLLVDDDSEIAIAWDKAWGLGHNGQRIRGFAHEVILIDGSSKGIALKEWPKFAMEQREKLAKLIASRTNGAPPIRWSDEDTLGTNWFRLLKR
jgi:hypothetical protein